MPYIEDMEGNRVVNSCYSLARLSFIHKEIIRLANLAYKPKEIAVALEIEPQTVYNVLGSELGRQELGRLQALRDDDAALMQERINAIGELSLDVIEKALLEDDTDKVPMVVKLGHAQTMVDRALGKPKAKLEIDKRETKVDADFLREVHSRAEKIREERRSQAKREAIEISGEIIEDNNRGFKTITQIMRG